MISSCTTVYIPTEVNTPVFRQEHQFTAGVSVSEAGMGLETGFAITKSIGVMAEGSYLNNNSGDVHNFMRYGEFGLGYFNKFKRESSIEIFSGIGFAYARSTDTKFNYAESGYYNKIFLQPDICYSIGEMDFIIALKMSLIKFTKYSYSHDQTAETNVEPSAFEFQPAFTLRFGAPFFKIRMQIGASNVSVTEGPDFERMIFGGALGIVIKI
jgi:hypothetical protein